jgi:uncharacterized protein (DUF2267 family)
VSRRYRVLHALRDRLQTQRAGDVDDGLHQAQARRFVDAAHEGDVDLELVGMDLVQLRQEE